MSPADALVIFGATGDLAFRMIFPALAGLVKRGRLRAPVIAVARGGGDLQMLRARVRQSLERAGVFDARVYDELSARLGYVDGDYTDPSTFVKKLGERMMGTPTELVVARDFSEAMMPYERLLGDKVAGNPTLFASQGEVEAQWAVVDPILDDATPFHSYEPGTWGPAEADAIVGDQGGWRMPTTAPPVRSAA